MSETFDCAECATSDDQDRIDALMADHSMPDVPLSDLSRRVDARGIMKGSNKSAPRAANAGATASGVWS